MENVPVFLSDRNQYRGTHETFPKMEHTPEFEEAALEIAKEWGEVERLVRLAIGAADVVQQLTGTGLLTGVTDIARSVVSGDLIPSVPGPIPHAAPAELPSTVRKGASATYFPACVNRIFGREVNSPKTQVRQKFSSLSRPAQESRFGSRTMYGGLCCSTLWSSKGYKKGGTYMAEHVVDAFWRWSEGGKLPIVVDAASCTLGMTDDVVEHLGRRPQTTTRKSCPCSSWRGYHRRPIAKLALLDRTKGAPRLSESSGTG
jgi:D-lactate dehydrogenase